MTPPRIIRDHVLDGIALAEAAGLPRVVNAFIPEHHGTTEITYFLSQARPSATGRAGSNPADFRYPGPAPAVGRDRRGHAGRLGRGRESACSSDADAGPGARGHRAARRSRSSPRASSTTRRSRLRDLDRIKREFARVMSGTYHKRIGYPRASGGVTPEFQTAERREVAVSGRRLPLPAALVRRVVEAVLDGERRRALISVTFLGRDAMRRLNAAPQGPGPADRRPRLRPDRRRGPRRGRRLRLPLGRRARGAGPRHSAARGADPPGGARHAARARPRPPGGPGADPLRRCGAGRSGTSEALA